MTKLHKIIIAVLIAIIAIGYVAWNRQGERQVRARFAALDQAFADGRSQDAMACIHPDYNFVAQWPGIYAEYGSNDPRVLASQALFVLFQRHRESPMLLTTEIHNLAEQPNGQWTATVSMFLRSEQGSLPIQVGSLANKTFTLQRDGLTALTIISHDVLDVRE